MQRYRGMVVRESSPNVFVRGIEELDAGALPPGDVLVRVMYSSLNYKDALSATGNRGVTKQYPHTPGIDAAGVVEASAVDVFKPGDEVIVTSYDLGMNTSGGLGQFIRVPASWVVKKPAGLTLREAMIFGTAGFTAALSLLKITGHGALPEGPVLVTGATGGVGSMAVSILSHIGFEVTALNGVKDEREFLTGMGARSVLEIDELVDDGKRPLLRERWSACVDTVGGGVLTSAIRSTRAYGAVSCCGNVVSGDISLTVYPFILRGISLYGIDSQNCPMPVRVRAWEMLAGGWKFPWLEKIATEVPLDGAERGIESILAGTHRGRTVVNLWN
jgi:putative YhdH/YhfP family quinone oxidoreductase